MENVEKQSQEFGSALNKEFQDYKRSVKAPNVLLIGGTGVGKSSLVNACFGDSLAKTAVGAPVTQQLEKFASPDVPVVLFDTKGYEVGDGGDEEFLGKVVDYVAGVQGGADQIHVTWYCIQASGHRVTDFDISTIRRLRELGVPVAVVLTKAELVSLKDAEALKSAVTAELGDVPVFEVSSVDKTQPWQLADLCEWSIEQLPEAMRRAFISAQRVSMKYKREECNKIIVQHVAASAAIAINPIPLSDGPLLLANQTTMIARIMYVYDVTKYLDDGKKEFIGMIIGPIIIRSGAMAAASLLKFIPGAGSIAGALINTGVATTITYAMGEAVIQLCIRMVEAELAGGRDAVDSVIEQGSEIIKDVFSDEMKKSRSVSK